MADSMATGWYYMKSGAATQQVGPLTWEQLYALCSSGSLQPADLVYHPTMPQWLPASQIPGLFQTMAQPMAYPPGAQPGAGYAPAYQPVPYQQAPYQQAGPPGWAGPAGYQAGYQPAVRKRSSVAAWLIPLIALVLVGGGLGAYFGFWYHKGGGAVSASELVGHWEGTVTYKTLNLTDSSAETQARRDKVLNKEIPATMDITLDEGVSSVAALTKAMAAAQKQAGGTAVLNMDVFVIDESYGTVTDTMTFTYSGNKLTFQPEGSDTGTRSVTAEVSRKGDILSLEGTMTFDDETGSGTAVWTVSMESLATTPTEDEGTGSDGTATTQGDGTSTFAPTDLNGTWNGILTITSYTGDPWAERGLTATLLGTITNLPIPVTMDITADESGTGTGKMVVSATALGAAFDIGTADMPLTTSGTTLTFQPESWPWGVPTMTGEVTQAGGVLTIDGTFSYSDAASSFEAVFNLTK